MRRFPEDHQMTPKQEEALRDYLRETVVPLIEDVLTKKLGQALTFAKEELAQPAPVQEPVATIDSLEQEIYENTREFVSLNVMEWLLNRLNTTPPAAQPAVPDAIHHTDLSEHPQYIEGWNDCRAEMLKGMK
jgi:hypothetical protein